MKNKYEVFIVALVILLPGCGGNVVDWGKKSFAQGGVYQDTHILIQSYMRDVKVYDMFDTLGSFDVLWLSDEVRTLYTQLHATMFGKTEDSQGIFLRRQLKANTQHLVFYVLAGKNISLSKKAFIFSQLFIVKAMVRNREMQLQILNQQLLIINQVNQSKKENSI